MNVAKSEIISPVPMKTFVIDTNVKKNVNTISINNCTILPQRLVGNASTNTMNIVQALILLNRANAILIIAINIELFWLGFLPIIPFQAK